MKELKYNTSNGDIYIYNVIFELKESILWKLQLLPKAIYRFSAILIRLIGMFFTEL